MNSMELSNYLEKIRLGRNLSQEEFVSGVVSIRQYQRYKNGDSVIPYEKINQFAEKFGVTTKKLLAEFEKEKNMQYVKINNFYNAVANNDYKNANKIKEDLEKDLIISEEGRKYFEHAKIVYDYYSRKLTMNEVINKISVLIDYPNILKQVYFTDVEVLILSFLLSIFSGERQEILLNHLNDIFKSDDNIMAGDSDYIYTLILMRIAKTYGIKRDYSKVIYYCDLGIKRGILYKQYYLWEYFFYYKALSYHALGKNDEFNNSILRCYNVLSMEDNHSKFEKFNDLIEKDFDINFQDYVVELIKSEQH